MVFQPSAAKAGEWFEDKEIYAWFGGGDSGERILPRHRGDGAGLRPPGRRLPGDVWLPIKIKKIVSRPLTPGLRTFQILANRTRRAGPPALGSCMRSHLGRSGRPISSAFPSV